MKHLVHLPLFAFLAAAVAGPAFAAAVPYDGQTEDGDYTFETPAQLLALGVAAAGFSFQNSTFTLAAGGHHPARRRTESPLACGMSSTSTPTSAPTILPSRCSTSSSTQTALAFSED